MAASHSFPEYPENDGQQQRNQDAGGQREVEAEPLALDVDVAGKMADAQPGQPRPCQPEQDEDSAYDQQPLCHGFRRSVPGSPVYILPQPRWWQPNAVVGDGPGC